MDQNMVNAANLWRLDTPGASGWPRSARPDAAQKYFMSSADGHANEPASLWFERIDAKYRERLPRVVTDKDGIQWRVSEGQPPRPAAALDPGGRGRGTQQGGRRSARQAGRSRSRRQVVTGRKTSCK